MASTISRPRLSLGAISCRRDLDAYRNVRKSLRNAVSAISRVSSSAFGHTQVTILELRKNEFIAGAGIVPVFSLSGNFVSGNRLLAAWKGRGVAC